MNFFRIHQRKTTSFLRKHEIDAFFNQRRPSQAVIPLSTAVAYRFSWQTNSIFQMVSIRIPLSIFISCQSHILIIYLQRRFLNNSNMEERSSSLCLPQFLQFRVQSCPHFPLKTDPNSSLESDRHCKLLYYAFLTPQHLTRGCVCLFDEGM